VVSFKQIKKALRGVKVEVTYRGSFRRKYRITGLTSQPTRELRYGSVIIFCITKSCEFNTLDI